MAMPRPDEQHCLSSFRSIRSSLVQDAAFYSLSSSLMSPSLTASRSDRFRGRVLASSLCSDVTAKPEHVMYTPSGLTASYVMQSSTRKLSRLSRENSVSELLQDFLQLAERNAHRIGWIVKYLTRALHKFANLVDTVTMKKLVRSFIVLKPSWTLFEITRVHAAKQLVLGSDDNLYTLEAIKSRIRKEFFSPVQRSFATITTALRAFAENSLKENRTSVRSSELWRTAAENDWKGSTRLEGRETWSGPPLEEYSIQEQEKIDTHFRGT